MPFVKRGTDLLFEELIKLCQRPVSFLPCTPLKTLVVTFLLPLLSTFFVECELGLGPAFGEALSMTLPEPLGSTRTGSIHKLGGFFLEELNRTCSRSANVIMLVTLVGGEADGVETLIIGIGSGIAGSGMTSLSG